MGVAKEKKERGFYRTLLMIVLPMTLQNLISAAVNSADVIMLGYVGQTAIAAASLANQIQFVLFLFYTGLSSGIIVMAAQYWGRGDSRAIEILLGMGLKLSLAVSFLFGLAAILSPQGLMRIFTNDPELIAAGAVYLRVVGWSYFFMGVSQIYECIIKSIERVKTATAIAGVTLMINVALNAVFIFGLFGAPRLGILGVAIATLTARIIEVLICVGDALRQRDIAIERELLTAWSPALFKDFCKYSLPALGNEFLWGAAFSAYSVVLGHLGSDIVAANSVVSAARNLCTVFVFGVAYGAGIILGKQIGEGRLEQARRDAGRILWIVFWSSLAAGGILLLIRPLIFQFTSLSETAYHYLNVMLYINVPYILGMGFNTVTIAGLFRAGGDARYGLIIDAITMWAVFVPLAFFCGFVLKLPPLLVYAIICCDEAFKIPFNIFHYKKRNWIKNITRAEAEL